jgi:hypothetical protein
MAQLILEQFMRLVVVVVVTMLEAVAQVYDAALKDPDPRVALVAAKQVSVELWGQPTQAVTGEGGGPLTVVLRRFTDAPEPDA